MLKPIVLRPIFGLAPGLVIVCGIGFVGLGVLSAVVLDKYTRSGSSSAVDAAPISSDFAEPDESIARTQETSQSLAWLKHSAPYPAGDTAPRVAIVVVDDGSDAGAALRAMRLPAPITLAIAPTADAAEKRAAAARRFGREVLLLMPMESENGFDKTPNPIAIHVPREELLRRIDWNLAQIKDYVGVMNQHGEQTTRDADTMRAVLEVIQQEGLSFVDARVSDESVGGAVARRLGVPTGDRIIAIARGADAADLGAGLASAVTHAEKWGTAIVTMPAERRLVTALQDWIDKPQSSVKIAPVTAVIKRLRSGKT